MQVEQRLWTRETGWRPAIDTSELGGGAQLVLLFGGVDQVRGSECLERVRRSYPKAHIVGCTTAGQIHDARVSDDTITLTAVRFEHTRVVLVRAPIESVEGSKRAGEQLARALDPVGLRHVFVLSEGLQVNASELVRGMPKAMKKDDGAGADASRVSVAQGGFCAGRVEFEHEVAVCADALVDLDHFLVQHRRQLDVAHEEFGAMLIGDAQ